MGRPLNKKYFGNRNVGSASTTGDDGLGGNRVGSVTIDTAGTYTTVPSVTFSAPDLAGSGAVTAVGTAVMKAVSATVGTSGTGDVTKDYVVGDVLTVTGDTGTAATFTVASTKVRTAAVQSQGTGTWVTGDTFSFSTGFATPAVLTVTAAAGAITAITITDAGVRSAAGALTDPVTPDSTSNGGGVQGVSFNLGMGVNAVTVASEGALTALGANDHATTTNSANGTGATLTVTYGVKSITVSEPGSGYSNAADAAVTFGSGAAAATVVLEADSGVQGASGNNENAIVAYAYHSGGSLLRGDITKQVSTDRYKVENATSTAIARLKSTIATAAGEMNIVAIDTDGKTYYVTKLTAHKATLVPAAVARLSTSAGTIHTSGSAVPWSFSAATTGYVQIENA